MNLDLDATGIEYVVSGFGNDIYTAAAAIVTIEVYGGGGNDQITGGTVDDNLWAGVGNDTLVGNDGADLLVGDLGADSLSGGAGNDRLYIDSDDTFIDGGTGFDAAYIATGTGVTLNMATSQLEWVTDFAGGNDTITAAGVAVGVEIYAGAGTDNLTGSSNSDLIFAGSGNDTVAGGDGADAIVGETGADSLSGGTGNDRLYVDSDDTLIDGGADTDAVYIVGGTGVTLNMATSNVEYVQDDVGAARHHQWGRHRRARGCRRRRRYDRHHQQCLHDDLRWTGPRSPDAHDCRSKLRCHRQRLEAHRDRGDLA